MKTSRIVLMITGIIIVCLLAGSVCGIAIFNQITDSIKDVEAKPVKTHDVVFEEDPATFFNLYINASTARVTISPATDGKIHLSYQTAYDRQYTLSKDDSSIDLSENGYDELLPFSFGGLNGFSTKTNLEIKLQIPENYHNDLSIRTATGSIRFESGITTLGSVNLETNTGSISTEKLKANMSFRGYTSTGSMTCQNTVVGDSVDISTNTGRVNIARLESASLYVSCSTGSISATEIDSHSVTLDTSTGSITGTVAGVPSDYTIESSTGLGQNNLPSDQHSGGRYLSATTSTGRIDIQFLGRETASKKG